MTLYVCMLLLKPTRRDIGNSLQTLPVGFFSAVTTLTSLYVNLQPMGTMTGWAKVLGWDESPSSFSPKLALLSYSFVCFIGQSCTHAYIYIYIYVHRGGNSLVLLFFPPGSLYAWACALWFQCLALRNHYILKRPWQQNQWLSHSEWTWCFLSSRPSLVAQWDCCLMD